uniref:Uncharacterized protein n=1 Tax=Romanomermis culicivorax TaxID=13658 RepID=A0A915J2X5_ROMCU
MTSSTESFGISGSGPWAAKWAGGASLPSIGQYDETTLTSPVVFGMIDRFKVTSVAYFGIGGGNAGVDAGAETTTAAKN